MLNKETKIMASQVAIIQGLCLKLNIMPPPGLKNFTASQADDYRNKLHKIMQAKPGRYSK